MKTWGRSFVKLTDNYTDFFKETVMKKISLSLSFFISLMVNSQEFKDTTFSVRDFTCHCKYNQNIQDDVKVIERGEKPAYYPGGESEWQQFVKKNLREKLKGKHEVQVRFEVDKNGDLSNFILLNNAPEHKYQEVVRVLHLSGKWFPSVMNGFCVKSFVRRMFEL